MIGTVKVLEKKFPDKGEVLVFTVFEDDFSSDQHFKKLDGLTRGALLSKAKLHEFKGKEDQVLGLELNDFYKHIIVIGMGKKSQFTLAKWRNSLADVFKKVKAMKHTSITLFYFPGLGSDYFEIGKQMTVAFYLSNYRYDVYKNKEEQKKDTKLLQLECGVEDEKILGKLNEGVEHGKQLSEGVYLTRDLVNQPASHQHPDSLVEEAKKIEKESKGRIDVKVLDEQECRKLGMGAFLSVAQGSDRSPKFIILHYQGAATQFLSQRTSPSKKRDSRSEKIAYISPHNSRKICLVGKTIIFDSGGLSLKPPSSMETMKMDMAGGATVLGIFKVLANSDDRNYTYEVYGVLPACENMVSGKATRPGDIVTALNGKTIEVLNTDAEGRLTLADGLSYAEKYIKPDVMLDLATLTGACMVALGTDVAGMFGGSEKLLKTFESIAEKEGEYLSSLPLHTPYMKLMKSDIADIRNISTTRWGGAITAALFLTEFVKKDHWVHFDIAGTAFNESSPHDIIPKGGTGWGIMMLVEFLRESTS